MSEQHTIQMTSAQHADFMAQQREHNSRMEEHAKSHADGVKQLLPALLEMVGKPEQNRMEDKRDYFAGQALAGDMANSADGVWGNDTTADQASDRAKMFYRLADAMIAAREVQS